MNIFKVNDISYPIVPSAISPTNEIIKKSERSLSGKMCVDYVTEKINLEIVWDILDKAQLDKIKSDFIKGDSFVKISYFSESDEQNTGNYYFDGIDYRPLIINEKIMWQNVSVKMLQE